MNVEETCEKIFLHYGTDPQILKAIEELGECVSELSRYLRTKDSMIMESLRWEVADACIMLTQMRFLLGPDQVDSAIHAKLARTLARMEREVITFFGE